MSDELTRAIAEALRESKALQSAMAFGVPDETHLTCLEAIADDIAPLIEARVREARAEGAAGALLAFMHEAECDADADLAALRSDQWAEEVRRG